MDKSYFKILIFIYLFVQSSCVVLTTGAVAGGGYSWYNGRIEQKLYHDKDLAYEVAKSFLLSKEAQIIVDDQNKGRLEAKVNSVVESGESKTYKLSFYFRTFKHFKAKDPSKPSDYEAKRIEQEKGIKTKLSFQLSDGINPSQSLSRKYFNEYMTLLN